MRLVFEERSSIAPCPSLINVPAWPRISKMRRHATGSYTRTMERHDLYDNRGQHRQARLIKAVDLINAGHGARTVHFGDIGGAGRNGQCTWPSAAPLYDTVGRVTGREAFQAKKMKGYRLASMDCHTCSADVSMYSPQTLRVSFCAR